VRDYAVKIFHSSRPARKRSLRRPRLRRGDAAEGGMPGACRNGIVKNLERSDSEPFHTGMGERNGTLNL
jgi:hypothetical protein